ADEPRHVHGNTVLEITWTIAPAIILVFIAIPTVQTIFRTQARAVPNALQVEVVGHQWWWEFRYPQSTVQSPSGKIATLWSEKYTIAAFPSPRGTPRRGRSTHWCPPMTCISRSVER